MSSLLASENRFRQVGRRAGDTADIAFVKSRFLRDGSLVNGLASQDAIDPVVAREIARTRDGTACVLAFEEMPDRFQSEVIDLWRNPQILPFANELAPLSVRLGGGASDSQLAKVPAHRPRHKDDEIDRN